MLNENIKNLRKQKGYTQETFAQELNVVRQTVSKWEKGYSVPDAVMLEKIAEVLDVSVSRLLDGDAEKKEDTTDLVQISEQLSVLNNQFARELARKRRNRKIAVGILSAVFAAVCIFCVFVLFPSTETVCIEADTNAVVAADIDIELDKAVSEVIFSNNASRYKPGECEVESHFVFGTKENGETVTVYLLESYAEFGFYNGFFIQISGGTVPAVFTFRKSSDGYELIDSKYAQDGGLYISSIKEMFPRKIAAEVIKGLSDEDSELMWIAEVKQAQAYLKSIDRQATISSYGNIYPVFLTDYGIEVEVENKILDMCLEYDTTVSNHEKIENGKRYVYQTDYDEQNDWVTFTKFEYDTLKIVEFIAVDGDSGEIVKNAKKPEKVKYRMGKIVSDEEMKNRFTTNAYYD